MCDIFVCFDGSLRAMLVCSTSKWPFRVLDYRSPHAGQRLRALYDSTTVRIRPIAESLLRCRSRSLRPAVNACAPHELRQEAVAEATGDDSWLIASIRNTELSGKGQTETQCSLDDPFSLDTF